MESAISEKKAASAAGGYSGPSRKWKLPCSKFFSLYGCPNMEEECPYSHEAPVFSSIDAPHISPHKHVTVYIGPVPFNETPYLKGLPQALPYIYGYKCPPGTEIHSLHQALPYL